MGGVGVMAALLDTSPELRVLKTCRIRNITAKTDQPSQVARGIEIKDTLHSLVSPMLASKNLSTPNAVPNTAIAISPPKRHALIALKIPS